MKFGKVFGNVYSEDLLLYHDGFIISNFSENIRIDNKNVYDHSDNYDLIAYELYKAVDYLLNHPLEMIERSKAALQLHKDINNDLKPLQRALQQMKIMKLVPK